MDIMTSKSPQIHQTEKKNLRKIWAIKNIIHQTWFMSNTKGFTITLKTKQETWEELRSICD